MTKRERQLFGTDGMRGVAGEYPLDPPTVFAFGQALGAWAKGGSVLIGMDTRESGPWLSEVLAGGLASEGCQVQFAGLITTPGLAWLTKNGPFAAGVMISASHNPYRDNGLKVFDHSGYKLPDETELQIEDVIFERLKRGESPERLALADDPGLDRQYLEHLASTFPHRLDGQRFVLDCANGASVHLAPELFRTLGAEVVAIACDPNGRNINEGCGALHVEALAQRVVAERADAGFAFDGDADRCIGVAASGKIVDGDALLLISARHRKAAGLPCDAVVSTVMSNLGFEKALERDGIRLLRAQVGDKYVLEMMQKHNVAIGGEQSGHVIYTDFATTGDGMLSALCALNASLALNRSLDDLTADFVSYPQKLVNVAVREKRPIANLPITSSSIAEAEAAFNGSGRVLVRYSGTENKLRVMVEGADSAMVAQWVDRIANAVRAELT